MIPIIEAKELQVRWQSMFIFSCIENEYTPHWTTESFREDSIRIAEKMGFEKKDMYLSTSFHLWKRSKWWQ
jgi:hypothetical protein